MLKSDTSQQQQQQQQHSFSSQAQRLVGDRTTRSRQRTSTSCTECRRRKQKCNQVKPTCNNCNRRYPPVVCSYAGSSKASRAVGNAPSVDATSPEIENGEPVSWDVLDRIGQYRRPSSAFEGPTSDSPRDTITAISRSTSHTPLVYEVGENQETALYTPSIEITEPNSRKSSTSAHSRAFNAINPTNGFQSYSPSSNASQDSYFSLLPTTISISPTEPYQALPFDASERNLELLHMFIHKLSHYMTSTDGQNSSTAFNIQWVPFMIQSPIFVNVALLTAAYFRAVARGDDVDKSVDVLGARVKLISKINEQLRSKGRAVTEEAIAAVMSFAYNELIYADKKSSLGHMRGLREMVRVYGGLDSIQFEPLRMMLARTDYQVACTYECPPFLHEEDHTAPLPAITSYPLFLDSPLLESDIRFVDSASGLGLSPECAAILDDMRFLTTSIIALTTSPSPVSTPRDETSPLSLPKFLTTAAWIETRLSSSPISPSPLSDPLLPSIRTASQIYALAISTRTPFSQACTAALLQRLWSQMWRVPLARWKTIPSIFHWLVLTVMPYARDKPEGRFLKGMVAAGMMAIGLVEWGVARGLMVGMRRVEGWLEEGRRREVKTVKVTLEGEVVGKRDVGGGENGKGSEGSGTDGEGRKEVMRAGRTRTRDTLEVPRMEKDDDKEERESVSPRHRTPENVVKV